MTDCTRAGSKLALLLICPAVWAGGIPATQLQAITVTGQTPQSEAISASQGIVSDLQLQTRPVARIAELLEFVPGMIATQHSGEGKANQYFLRGFNLDHGTDFASFVDGMPVNMRSHGHGQGYSDLNFLIPELVQTLAYRKGPYYADVGDFSAAGSANFSLRNQMDGNLAQLTLGENEYQRALLAGSSQRRDGHVLLALDVGRYQGPWVLDQDLSRFKLLSRYSRGDESNGFNLTLMAYDSEWNATDQIPLRAVQSGQIDRLGFIDPSVGGDSSRYSLSFEQRIAANNGGWTLSGYAIDYKMDLFSNFTYFLENPSDGDQFEQLDERRVYGLNLRHQRQFDAAGAPQLTWGAQLRHDAISAVGLFNTKARQRFNTVRLDQVDETSLGLYAQLELQASERLRLISGLRLDAYRFEVDAQLDANSGRVNDEMLSPKFSAIFAASPRVNLFLNLARGFHSNDARGTTIAVDPASSTLDPVAAVEPLVAADAADLGVAMQVTQSAHVSLSLWALNLDSELVYVGDGGATEASDASRRYGLEIASYLTPTDGLILDLDYAWSHARLDNDSRSDRVPNAVEHVASLGVTVAPRGAWSGGLRVRYLGPAPLIEDNSQRSDGTFVTNLQLQYTATEKLRLSLSVFNLLDSQDQDITYFYSSRLPGEAAQGVEDIHFHPVEPRQLRAELSWRF